MNDLEHAAEIAQVAGFCFDFYMWSRADTQDSSGQFYKYVNGVLKPVRPKARGLIVNLLVPRFLQKRDATPGWTRG